MEEETNCFSTSFIIYNTILLGLAYMNSSLLFLFFIPHLIDSFESMEWAKIVLQGDLALEDLAAAEDLDGVGAGEGGGKVDVALYIYKSREHDIIVLIQQLDGGAECARACRQCVTIYI